MVLKVFTKLGLVTLVKVEDYLVPCVTLGILYAGTVAVYRLAFHPLADFPGPALARSSYLYEFWYDVVLKGRFTRKIADLHEIYGVF